MSLKIITWNVNWIRAIAKKWFKDFIKSENPDILCIQETKAFEDQFLKDVGPIGWYKYVWHAWERPGYAGTAIFYKENLKIIDTKKHFDEYEHFYTDWRVTEIEFEYSPHLVSPEGEEQRKKRVVLFNWYFPNWWTRADWTEMLSYKLEFYDHLIDYSRNKSLWRPIFKG